MWESTSPGLRTHVTYADHSSRKVSWLLRDHLTLRTWPPNWPLSRSRTCGVTMYVSLVNRCHLRRFYTVTCSLHALHKILKFRTCKYTPHTYPDNSHPPNWFLPRNSGDLLAIMDIKSLSLGKSGELLAHKRKLNIHVFKAHHPCSCSTVTLLWLTEFRCFASMKVYY